ncbi:MAG: lysine--tRNA ligase [Weeksellaceae bacterium]|nr:lysine--tRNA ligase [Weeksellaceae bacterium]
MSLSEQEIIRREKLAGLRELNIEPYPAAEFERTHSTQSLKQEFENGVAVKLAGRLMSRRIQGKASFAEIQDQEGRFQLYFNRDELSRGDDSSLYNEVYKKLLDIGDFIGISGETFTTQVGEKSILVKDLVLLSKSLRPLPLPKTDSEGNVHDAFTDPELRYRQRYADLTVNQEVRQVFLKRSRIFQAMREFFNNKGYLEVETPVLQPIPGGAIARPFTTHHNALNIPLYLRIANELYLKRLIVGGFEGVYEFAKNFRNEGMDRTHNPEFTIMEIYVAYKDYLWMMEFTENLLEHCAKNVLGDTVSQYGEHQINWKAPYARVSMRDAIEQYTGFDITGKSEDQLREAAKSMQIEVDDTMGEGKLIDAIFGEKCEPHFIQPTFIIDYPKSMSPLTKPHRDDPHVTERFELIVAGKEVANAYSELNDPIDQRERFENQLQLSKKGDDEAMFIDQDFLRALEYGMPPTAGLGIGMDRLVMFMTNQQSIQEVLFFPQMKPEQKLPEISEDAKMILELTQSQEQALLQEVKDKSALSNKKWDKAVKELTRSQLVKVWKEEENLFIAGV